MLFSTRTHVSERTNSQEAATPPQEKGEERIRCVSPGLTPKFVDHPDLRSPSADDEIFAEAGRDRSRENSTNERDLRRFKRMHFCALRMEGLVRQHGAGAVGQPDYRQFSELYRKLQDEIASENVGLVYDVYKRTRFTNVDGDDLMSDGMLALTRAICTFDPWRGFRFSTYAWNVIVRALHNRVVRESRRRRCKPVSFDSGLEKGDLPERRHREQSGLLAERMLTILEDGTVDLTRMERDVMSRRFPMDPAAKRPTLDTVGREMQLSKERVRQIQNAALKKLRRALNADPVLN